MFKLSDMLGGRSEVVGTKASELFQYMIMAREKDEEKVQEALFQLRMNHMSRIYSQPSEGGEKAEFKRGRDEFYKLLDGQQTKRKEIKPASDNVWDLEQLRAIKARQKGGK